VIGLGYVLEAASEASDFVFAHEESLEDGQGVVGEHLGIHLTISLDEIEGIHEPDRETRSHSSTCFQKIK